MKGMATCKVCDRDFALIEEEHYIAQNSDREGGLGIAISGKEQPIQYDAFDCPHCGCQYIAQERKRIFIPDDIDINQLFNDNDEDDLK